MRRIVLLPLLFALVASLASPAGAGGYDDPFFLNWPTYLTSGPTGDYTPSTEADCPKGSTRCVDAVIKEMTRRFNAVGCHHDSAFAFTYLLTTEEYRRAIEDPAFFTDTAFVNHQDAVFADYYFRAHDAWRAGRVAEVPPAWRIAFDAAGRQQVTGMGNVLLGMNAHVNRDLPFVLAGIGLVKPDGSSRKVDHDRVNAFLAQVNTYLLAEAAKVLDPTLDDGDAAGTTIDNMTSVQLLVAWREQAWRNAERLAAATTDAERAWVAQSIEDQAAAEALTIRAATAYPPLLGGAAARNAFCASHFTKR